MPKVIFEAGSERIEVAAQTGETVMLAALVGMVPGIEAECGGACSCGTCQVVVPPQWQAAIGEPGRLESEMLAALEPAHKATRLSCQIRLHEGLDGLQIQVP